MHHSCRPFVRCLFLLACMQILSAYSFRCWMFCTEQTAIQNDYIEQRDICRRYAQLRIDTDTSNAELLDERARTSKMVSLFSACMSEKGWTIPEAKQQGAAAVPIQNNAAPPIAAAAGPNTAIPASSATAPAAAPAAGNAAPAPTAKPAVNAPSPNAAALAAQRREKAFLARSTECAFARHGAAYSSVSAARAKACDLECAQRLRDAPDAPRPAACPAGGESSEK